MLIATKEKRLSKRITELTTIAVLSDVHIATNNKKSIEKKQKFRQYFKNFSNLF